jgi:hypothetical protein
MNLENNKEIIMQALKDRVDSLQHKIAEIQTMQQQSDIELAYYRELHKLYRRILEAEELGPGHKISTFVDTQGSLISNTTILPSKPTTVADAVRRVMAEHPGELMHRIEVGKAVRQLYPAIISKSKDFEVAVESALQAGKEKGLWKWVRNGTYQYR